MKIGRSWLSAVVVALVVLGVGTASAGPKGGQSQKVDPALMALHSEHAAFASQKSVLAFASSNSLARVVDERVVIDAVADGDVRALETALSSLGVQNIAVFGRVISGELPISAIPTLDAVASLRFAQLSYAGRRAGSVTSQGDQAMRADMARATFGVTGAGVQVGALSDSFNCLGGAAADVASGDLSPVTVVQEISSCQDAVDEGRAILQIIHDVAPGASLSFASAFNGMASFANNILALEANGARVIVDDIFYFREPMFQDGIIAQAVDTVVGRGAAYFSAAGNEGRRAYESVFRAGASFTNGQFPSAPGAPHFFGGTAHNFAPSGPPDHVQRITIPSGRTLIITFQWDSPFFSVSGGSGSPNDVDIYLLNAAGSQVVAGSFAPNVGRDAVEVVIFTNAGPTADFNLMIVSFAGPLPGFIKYIQLGSSSITIAEFDTASGTVFGHANATGAAAVGAAFFAETPPFGVSPPVLEAFSSAGPTRIIFDAAGNRLASPVIRPKPDIVAPDGVNTTFFDADIPEDPDSFPNFLGTSAAAPHAAGVGALLMQLQPTLTPAGTYAILERTAMDMGTPGFDFDTGFGLVQADVALQFLSAGPQISLGLNLNKTMFVSGDTFQADVVQGNAGAEVFVDVYFGVLLPVTAGPSFGCPGGDGIVLLAEGFTQVIITCLSASPLNLAPLSRQMWLPTGLPAMALPNFFSFVWPPDAPPGANYVWFIAFTRVGTLDVLAVATVTVSFSP